MPARKRYCTGAIEVALTGRGEVLASAENPLHPYEIDDPDLLDIPVVTVDHALTRGDLGHRTLAEVAETLESEVPTRGVFVKEVSRGGQELPIGTGLVLERGDILRLVGAKRHVERVAARLGSTAWPSDRHRHGCARACDCDRRLDRLTCAAFCRRRHWTERARRNTGRRTRGGLVACAAANVRPRAGGSIVSAEFAWALRFSGGGRDRRRTDVCRWCAKGRHSAR